MTDEKPAPVPAFNQIGFQQECILQLDIFDGKTGSYR